MIDLAYYIGVCQPWLWATLHGKYPVKEDFVDKMCEKLNIDYSERDDYFE